MLSLTYLFEDKLLKFPTSRQDNAQSCGAAVQSVLAYYGIDQKLDDLADEMNISKDGINYTDIINKFQKHKFLVDSGRMNINMIKEYIDNDYPVIILIQAYKDSNKKYTREDYSDGHYVVVIGYDDNNFAIEDPSLNNKTGYIPFKELDIRWHGIGKTKNEKLDYFGIAIIGKPKYDPTELKKVE